MEPDRYRHNHKLYIIGMFFLAMSLCLFAFCVYVFPHLLLGWVYDVPEFIADWRNWLHINHGYSDSISSLIIFLFIFFLAVAFAVIAYAASNYIDDKLYDNRTETTETITEETLIVNEESRLWITLFKIALVVLIAILLVVFLDLIVYHPPHPQYVTPGI